MSKIASLEAICITLPFKDRVSDSWGTYTCSNHGVVIITSDDGVTGIGEVAFAWFGGAHSLCQEINNYWSEFIVGKDVGDINSICSLMDRFCSFSKRHLLAKAGVEMALWDLLGKTLGVPVYTLFGGKRRDKIPLTGGIAMGSLEQMIEEAHKRISEGYRELKIKVGLDEENDLRIIKAIRKEIGDNIALRVDVNMAWRDVKRALRFMDEMYELGVHIVEQPIGYLRIEDMALLTAQAKPHILSDESVWNVEDAKLILENKASDLLHIYISEAGGIKGSLEIAQLADVYGVDCTIGSMPEGRIGSAASLHSAAVMKNLSEFPSDIRGFTIYEKDVTNEDLCIVDGCIIVPDGPGLGVTLDPEKLNYAKRNGGALT